MEELERRLERWRREFRSAVLVRGGLRLAAAVCLGLTAALAIDAYFPLALPLRWGLFWAGVAALAAAGTAWIAKPLLESRPERLLRDAGRCRPELTPYLLPAWELSKAAPPPGASAALLDRHLESTETLLRRFPDIRVYAPPWPSRRNLALGALAVVVACVWLGRSGAGIGRILFPWRERPLESRLALEPGSRRLPWASPVEIKARWLEGRRDASVELWMRSSRSPWSRVPWSRAEDGSFGYSLPELVERLEYQLRWRDQRTQRFALEPIPAPQLLRPRLRIYPPGEEALGKYKELSLEGVTEISALQGSWLVFSGATKEPIAKAALRVSFLNGPVELRRIAGGFEGGFPLREDGRFYLELLSEEGASDPAPVSYGLKATADKRPEIELLSPAFEIEASPRERLPVVFQASDDYGLVAISLLFRLPGRGESWKELPVERYLKAAELSSEYAWDLSGIPLGEKVEFRLRATDNHRPSPQESFSENGSLRVVDFDAAHAEVERHWLGLEKALSDLALKQERAAELAARMADASPERKRELEGSWAELDKQLGAEWPAAVEAMRRLADSMSRDPYSNPGVTEQAAAAAAELQRAAAQELPAAQREARQGQWRQASARHSLLAEAARRGGKSLSAGRELQGLQDLWTQADRLEQSGSELGAALSKWAAGGRAPSPQESRELQQALAKLEKELSALSEQIQRSATAPPTDTAGNRKAFVVPLSQARRTTEALQRALAAGEYGQAARLASDLAEQLAKTRQAIADAAEQAAAEGTGGEDLKGRMEETAALWEEAVREQTAGMASTQKLEDAAVQSLLEAQKELLKALEARQRKVASAAAALPGKVSPEILSAMNAALEEFAKRSVSQAPQLLEAAARGLRVAASGPDAPKLRGIAEEEESILEQLRRGAPAPPPDAKRISEGASAVDSQARASARTEELRKNVAELSERVPTMPFGVRESVESARASQGAAEKSLSENDAAAALKHQARALEYLSRGRDQFSSAVERQTQIQSGSRGAFKSSGRRTVRVPGGREGAHSGFVRLPSAKEYQPPAELRQELERSLRERRPRAYDAVIREYLKRMSQ